MIKAGNRVNFELGNCFIQNKTTGAKTKIEERGGSFEFDLWVPTMKKEVNVVQTKNSFATLAEDEEENESALNQVSSGLCQWI